MSDEQVKIMPTDDLTVKVKVDDSAMTVNPDDNSAAVMKPIDSPVMIKPVDDTTIKIELVDDSTVKIEPVGNDSTANIESVDTDSADVTAKTMEDTLPDKVFNETDSTNRLKHELTHATSNDHITSDTNLTDESVRKQDGISETTKMIRDFMKETEQNGPVEPITTKKTSGETDKLSDGLDVPDELREMLKDLTNTTDEPETLNQQKPAEKVTTENLISVLQDDVDDIPAALSQSPSVAVRKPSPFSMKPPTIKQKRYLYKLKSKSGKVLRYTSTTPIVLKKPVIKLEKMSRERIDDLLAYKSESSSMSSSDEEDELKSLAEFISRTKPEPPKPPESLLPPEPYKPPEKMARFIHTGVPSSASVQQTKRRGRPPKNSSYSPSTRPSTTIRPQGNRSKLGRDESPTSDYENDAPPSTTNTPSFGMQTRKRKLKFLPDGSLLTSTHHRFNSDFSKLDFSSDTDGGLSSNERSDDDYHEEEDLPTVPTKKRSYNRRVQDTSRIEGTKRSLGRGGRVSLNAAQLMSSLMMEEVSMAALVQLRFKSKALIDAAAMKKEQEKQKPGPKSLTTATKQTTAAPKRYLTASNNVANIPSEFNDKPSFDDFMDTGVVRTKRGPKKAAKYGVRMWDENRTIIDFLLEVHALIPGWNLHVLPREKTFCFCEVAFGRTGVPVLKKSIVLGNDFSAKVFVHQLHCKRFDGIYETEEKIIALIQEVDSIAA